MSLEIIKRFQDYGMKLIPLQDGTKKPQIKFGKWKGVSWSNDEIQSAKRLGVMHEESGVLDIDADSKEAQKYMHLLPETLTIGKKIDGRTVTTHKLYFYSGKSKTESLGKNTDDGCQIELLTNTQTHVIGDRVIINDTKPTQLTYTDYQQVRQTLRKIYTLAILTKHYPPKGLKKRDDYVFRVAGMLAHECKHWETYEKENFIEQLITVNGDTNEFQNRIKKVAAQEENLKLGKEVSGVKGLCDFIGIKQLDCVDKLRKEEVKGITVLKFGDFLNRKYPPVNYVIYPLMATETIMQVWSMPGIGKTWFGLELAASIASGKTFLRWDAQKDINKEPVSYPILYVEGEMRASALRDRIVDIQTNIGSKFNFNYFNIAPLAEQPNETFLPLNEERGRENIEIRLREIYEETGKKPFLFLDNISCLTNIQEKDGVEWISFMSWLIKLRARGYTVIFFHHSTKEGSTSSGSNMKERAVDIEIKLERPEKEEFLEKYSGAQFKVSFPKWREFANSIYAKPFIATLDRDSHEWRTHEILKKTKRIVKDLLNTGSDIEETMKAAKLSKAQVYRYKKEIKKETAALNAGDAWGHRKSGKIPAFTKKANKETATKKVLDQINQQQLNGVKHDEK
jgi:hypothetical protein